MLSKLIAMGLVQKPYTYLRDAWSWIDVFVIVISYISIVYSQLLDQDTYYLAAIKALCVLRAFKFINSLPGNICRSIIKVELTEK